MADTNTTTTAPEPSTSQLSNADNTTVEDAQVEDTQTTIRHGDGVVIELGNVPEDEGVGTVTFTYPKMPENTDFETFRKKDPSWRTIVEWYNNENGVTDKSDDDSGVSKEWKERFVLQHWPRDPNGPPLLGHSGGKYASNGHILWGATLYDFYMVERIPGLANLRTITTGSRMAAFCRSIGELDFAKQQIGQADMEERPLELPPYPTWKLIEEMEELVRRRKHGKPLKWKGKDAVADENGESPFNHGNQPEPWPLRPFSTFTPRLQSYIPLNSLPEILIVHDPWNILETPRDSYLDSSTLHARSTQGNAKYKWCNAKDRTRRYKLYPSTVAAEAREKEGINRDAKSTNYRVPDCREAHMYITPYRRIGQGHHSLVYQVEVEVPRDLVVQPRQCHKCSMNALDQSEIFQEAKRTGDEVLQYSIAQKIVEYQLPPYCEHMDKGPVPGTARVSVVAKLALASSSGTHERHLRLEASNYQKFPRDMFEHYNGYNIIAPIHEPTPVGAVVPQFYGFYEPEEKSKSGTFLSPIMLIEHCGTQVDASDLSFDDRRECFSLLLRLHHADYVHNSVATRNFLMQYGPVQGHPSKRSKKHVRFRLADFGRTVRDDEHARGAMMERSQANDELRLKMY